MSSSSSSFTYKAVEVIFGSIYFFSPSNSRKLTGLFTFPQSAHIPRVHSTFFYKSIIENLLFQEHAENLCYCKQREDRGVKDVFQIEFMIKSKLYISDMSYTMSEFGRQKSMLEKSVDEMILRNLNESVVKPAGFVRSQVMQVRWLY